MAIQLSGIAATIAFIISSCSSSKDRIVQASPSSDTTYSPVEINKPNTNYKPAFAGQTRIESKELKLLPLTM